MAHIKCFVPTCKNDSINSPDKIFVRIREDLRKKWCMEANAEYFNVQLLYCCEDHFDPVADLKNYFKYKLMNQEPILKPTAVLKNIAAFPQEQEIPTTSQDSSELLKMLSMVQPGPSSRKIRKLDNVMPSTSSATTLPIKVHVATQCKVKMVDSSTNLRPRKRKGPQGATSFEVHSSQEFSSATTPSLFGYTSETEETTSEKPKQMRNNVYYKQPHTILKLSIFLVLYCASIYCLLDPLF